MCTLTVEYVSSYLNMSQIVSKSITEQKEGKKSKNKEHNRKKSHVWCTIVPTERPVCVGDVRRRKFIKSAMSLYVIDRAEMKTKGYPSKHTPCQV